MASLSAYDWPGNIRELQDIIERAVVLSSGPVLRLGADLLPVNRVEQPDREAALVPGRSSSLEHVERAHIIDTLCACV